MPNNLSEKMTIQDVSIIIPSYNGERYIPKLVKNLKGYHNDGVEIIIVEDGSKDKTEQILKQELPKAKYIWQKNSGVAFARNTGVLNAKGKFVQLLDVDDTITSDKLSKQLDCAINNQLDLVYSDWRMVINRNNEEVFEPWVISGSQKDVIESLLEGWWNPPHSYLIKKSAYLQVMSDEKLVNAQDFDLLVQLGINGFKFGYCAGYFSNYFRYKDTISLARGPRGQYWSDTEKVIKKALKDLEEKDSLTKRYKLAAAKRLFHMARNVYNIDIEWNKRLYSEVKSLVPNFYPKSQSLTFRIAFLILGYHRTEKLISILK